MQNRDIVKFSKQWRKKNTHNYTFVENIFPIEKVKVGNKTYGRLNVLSFSDEDGNLNIGSYCSISKKVVFLLGGEHKYNTISTFPFEKYVFGEAPQNRKKGNITIGDDVWIGYGSVILSGVSIGQGAIIGAGSTVHKDVPPYAIYGNGKIIKYRFEQEVIDELVKIDWSKIDDKVISENREVFEGEITKSSLDAIRKLPHK